MSRIKRARNDGVEIDDPFLSKLPTLPNFDTVTDYLHVSIPCVLAPYLIGAILPLLNPNKWDHSGNADSLYQSIGMIENLVDSLSSECNDLTGITQYIRDLYQDGCSLIAVDPDLTERLVFNALWCVSGGIGDPPPGWTPPPDDEETGWDHPEDLDPPPGGFTDQEWCGIATKAAQYVKDETRQWLFGAQFVVQGFAAVVDWFPPGTKIPGWALTLASQKAQDLIDGGINLYLSITADTAFFEALQCAFYCAFKNYNTVNADAIQDAFYQVGRDNVVYTPVLALWEPIFNLDTYTGKAQYWGSILNRRNLANRSWLGADEPNNDCEIICDACNVTSWKATLDLRRGNVQGLITLLTGSSNYIVDPWVDTAGLHSGYYKSSADYFPTLKFRLSFGSDALITKMRVLSYVDPYYELTHPTSDYVYIVPEGGGSTYESPCPRGSHEHYQNHDPRISPDRIDYTYVLSKTQDESKLSGGMIHLSLIELWGDGEPPAALIPFSELFSSG